MKRPTKLRREHIIHIDEFHASDADEARLVFGLILKQGFIIDPRISWANRVLPGYEKYLWRADQRSIAPESPGVMKVRAIRLFHLLMHRLVGKRYGYDLLGKPAICLLGEALASSLDIYFTSKMMNLSGLRATQAATTLQQDIEAAKLLKRGFLKNFSKAQRDPFLAYKEMVFYMHDLSFRYRALATERPEGYDPKQVYDLISKVQDSRFGNYVSKFGFTGFSLYADARCGRKSSREDREKTKDCKSALEKAQSLSEFLLFLETDY